MRLACLVFAILVASLPRTTVAQQQIQIQIGRGAPGRAANATGTASQPEVGAALFVADREQLIKLSRANELVADRQFDEAIELLHEILQGKEETAKPSDKTHTVLRNLRVEAERLLAEMPASTLETYDRYYNADAKLILNDAIELFDFDKLAETSRRYFHTTSGYEATYLLGAAQLDRGRPFDAAVWFERLRMRRPVQKNGRDMLALQAAMAWALAGLPELAKPCLLELKTLTPGNMIKLGDRSVRLFDEDEQALDWLYKSVLATRASNPSGDHWPVSRGNVSRTAKSIGKPFAPHLAWKSSTSTWKVPIEEAPFSGGVVDVSRQLKGLEHDFHKYDLAALPSTDPLIVDDVALVRTQSKLLAIDLESGEPIWESNGENVLEQVRRGTVPPLPGDTGSILDPILKDRLFANSTYGTMSAGNDLVFCLEDLGFDTALNNIYRRSQTPHPLAMKTHNRLCAYSIKNGRIKWSVGGKADDDKLELAGHYFLGPPLPLGRRLFCLAETNKEIRLVVLNATTGQVDWSKTLQTVAIDVSQDEHRGRAGLSPSYADGLLVCPTCSGLVVAVDLATRQLMWSYRYRELDAGNVQNLIRMRMIMQMRAARGDPTVVLPKKTGRWHDSLPTIVGGKVFVTPRDSEELHCLNLMDGTLQWKLPKENRRYVAGVYQSKLVVVGNRHLEMLNTGDGKPAWSKPLEIPLPSGRGILAGNTYLLPLSTAAIATIDLDKARLVSSIKFDDGLILGNLISVKGFVLSQSTGAFACFKPSNANREATSQ